MPRPRPSPPSSTSCARSATPPRPRPTSTSAPSSASARSSRTSAAAPPRSASASSASPASTSSRKVLNLADDFDRAIDTRPANLEGDAWADGIAAIDRKLRLLLESEGVTAIEAAPGMPFDPRHHEAVVSVPGTGRAEGEIVDEIRRGYRLRNRVIRPALVAVAAPGDAAGPGGPIN